MVQEANLGSSKESGGWLGGFLCSSAEEVLKEVFPDHPLWLHVVGLGFGSAMRQVSEAAWAMRMKDKSSETAAALVLTLFEGRLRFVALFQGSQNWASGCPRATCCRSCRCAFSASVAGSA